MESVIRRANNTVRSEALKGITSVYAITRQNVRADTTIKVRTQKVDGGVVGMVSFAGYKIPLYRFNVSPTLPVQRATVSAAVLAEILRRAKEEPEALHAAPASTPVGRPDETAAARRPVVRYAFPEG